MPCASAGDWSRPGTGPARLRACRSPPLQVRRGLQFRCGWRRFIHHSGQPGQLLSLDGIPHQHRQLFSDWRGLVSRPMHWRTYKTRRHRVYGDSAEEVRLLAIYGSRASNGVVLITTKRGKAQKSADQPEYLLRYAKRMASRGAGYRPE